MVVSAFKVPRSQWPRTTDAEGLRRIAQACRDLLRRLGVQIEIERASAVPETGGLVFMWNQESHLDHIVLPSVLPRPFFSLYNNAVAGRPVYGRYLRDSGHVHVDKTDESQWRRGVARAASQIREGECAVVSPEGTRSWDGELLPMKRGAFIMAIQSQRPIVCVTLLGGHQRLPRGSSAVRPGVIRAVFSDPIPTAGHDPERRAPLKARVAEEFTRVKTEFRLS